MTSGGTKTVRVPLTIDGTNVPTPSCFGPEQAADIVPHFSAMVRPLFELGSVGRT